jgi:hypothetical protein
MRSERFKNCEACGAQFSRRMSSGVWSKTRFCSSRCFGTSLRHKDADFLRYLSPEPNSGCWLWTGPVRNNRSPYGQYGRRPAHRYSYERQFGPIPDGCFVCHRCDTPSCVNPDHLFVGTPMDNSQDCVRKGRNPRGVTNRGGGKLTEAQVTDIRRRYSGGALQRDIAAAFGVSQPMVSSITRGASWRHLP